MTDTKLGRIKWFNSSKGFGFVTDLESNNDVFAHHSGISVKAECWKTLYPGEYVSYEVHVDDQQKTHAVNITGVRGGPLLCETRHELNKQRKEYKSSQNTGGSDAQ